jgi:hypothetical protein
MRKVGSIEQLKEVSVLRDLSDSDIISLQPHTNLCVYQKGEIVMREGERLSPQLHILRSCTNTETLVKAEILGYPQGAPLHN